MENKNKILLGIAAIFLVVIAMAAMDVQAQENATGLPDLAVSSLSVSNPNPQINEVFTVTFTVTNKGTADYDTTQSPYGAGYELHRSDSFGDVINAGGTVKSLKVGESQTLSFQTSISASPAKIYVVIDRENRYAELDETNNEKSQMIYWPDLVVTDMKLYQSDFKIGDIANGVATIKNIGNADTVREVSLKVYKTDSSGTVLLGTSTRTFRAGESFDVEIRHNIAYSPTTFKVVIDSENLVSEADETNNEKSITVYASSSSTGSGGGGGGTATNQTSGGSGGGGSSSGGGSGGGGGSISEPKPVPIYPALSLDVSTDKYYYTLGEQVKISGILTGGGNLGNADVKAVITYTPSCPTGYGCAAVVARLAEIKLNYVGAVAPACEYQEGEGGVTTCPAYANYYYVGYYTPTLAGGKFFVNGEANVNGIIGTSSAQFETIGKVHDEEYDSVDLSISPEEQKTIVGEPVTYLLTIQDKHKGYVCKSDPCPLYAIRSYTYNLEIFGLQYPSSFSQSSVALSAGESEEVKLTVYPSSTVIQQTVTAVPVEVRQTTAVTEPAAPTVRPLVAVEERVTTKVTGQQIAATTGSSGGGVAKESATVIAQHDQTYQSTVRFTVKASQSDNDRNSDKASAVLHVYYYRNLEPQPPSLPEGEEVTLVFEKGWNLINLPGEFVRTTESTSCGELGGFVYFPGRGYIKLDKSRDIIGDRFVEYFSTHSFWVRARQSCKITVEVSNFASYSGLELSKGWNFLGTTKDMVGETLNSIKGTCSIEKAYTFSTSGNKWGRFGADNLITNPYKGIVVKTSGQCTLGENSILPPALPEEEPQTEPVEVEKKVEGKIGIKGAEEVVIKKFNAQWTGVADGCGKYNEQTGMLEPEDLDVSDTGRYYSVKMKYACGFGTLKYTTSTVIVTYNGGIKNWPWK